MPQDHDIAELVADLIELRRRIAEEVARAAFAMRYADEVVCRVEMRLTQMRLARERRLQRGWTGGAKDS